ncbi:T9SS type A sorting domain-containing protein [Flavobacterium sp. N1736]|uniref:T9SS type A sorting domain-containing protein n=1 Tax=Flavobacterium sp. N1736 TaxID=2986823 RepID=UPI0022240275|nr:PKD-like domain-containing protein [Flavobacterium sp. N1736]
MKHFYSQIKNFINIALFLGIFLQSYVGHSQTLAAGDLVFTGYDSNFTPSATVSDIFSFVLLKNVPAGTQISFTDRGYFGGTWQAALGTEGAVTWTTGTSIALGTEIIINGLTASTYNNATNVSTPNGTVALTDGTMVNGLHLSNVGDQIIAFQGGGGSVTGAGVTFISGIHYFYCNAGTGTSQASWDDLACADGPNSSVLPVGLTGGTDSFYTGTLAGNILAKSARFNGSGTLLTAAQIRTAVLNPANWELSTTGLTMPSDAPFLGVLPTVTNPPNRTVCPGTNTTFPVTATDATSYQWQVNTGSGFTDLTNVAPYSNVTTATLTITGATAAMSGYTYRIVATGAGSATSNPATLSVPNMTITTTAQTNPTCNGGTNGSATLTVSGGIPPYTYSWSPSGGTAATASNLAAGTYTVTVTDNIACFKTHTVTIVEPTIGQSSPAITMQPSTYASCAGSNAAFSVTASNTASYQWQVNSGSGFTNITNGGTSPNYAGATTANLAINAVTPAMNGYLYRAVLTSSCSNTTPTNGLAQLIVNTLPVATATPASQTICSGTSPNIALTSTPPGATFAWTVATASGSVTGATASSGTSINQALTGNGTVIYTVTPTLNSCPGTPITVAITVNPLPVATATPSSQTICSGSATNIALTSTPTGATFAWTATSTGTASGASASSGTSIAQTLTGSGTVTYTVTPTINGCPGTPISVVITVNPLPVAVATPASKTICSGTSPNIALTSTPTGATFAWTAALTSGTVTGFSASSGTTLNQTLSGDGVVTYTVTPTLNGCPGSPITVPITVTGLASITAQASNSAICAGGSTTFSVAAINASSYQWQVDTGSGYSNITNNATYAGAQTATLTISAATGTMNNYSYRAIATGTCNSDTSLSRTLTVNAVVANPSHTNVSCNGGSNGTATVTPSGGNTPYTYLWSNGATSQSITGLGTGNYSVTIKDANLCETTQNFTITEPAVLTASAGTVNNTSCNGGSNGSATVTVTGGTGTYTYLWAPSGGTGATASGLAAGTYTVTVKDANLCQTTQSFTITEPTLLTATTSQTDILCNGAATGSATVNVTGGTGTYTYLWSPSGGTAATASGLTAGTYTVTIKDANLCQITESFTINQPSALVATPVAQTNIGCRTDATGSATVSVTGGTGTYTYLWSPSGGTAATASGLTAGTYTVTVKDANLCQTTQSFTITQPAAILSATTASVGVSCFGGSNGSASVTASGGTPTYTYAWAPLGGTGSSISGRPAGDYTCTITDANGCSIVKNITISTPAAFSATTSQTNVSCNGGSNGSATVTASGATAPYTYVWSPTGGTAATASGLQAGTYTVTITDANTCVYTVNVTINQPDALTVTPSQTNVLCNGGATGSATVSATGGTGTYTYLWSPSGGTAATATGLASGNYNVLVTDANGCSFTQSFIITQPAILAATTSQINATCSTGGQAAVTPSGGTTPYTYSWSNGETTQIVTGLLAGNYSVIITDANGCTLTKNFTITTTNTLTATTSQTNVLCNSSNTGTATVVPSGAPGPFTYVWSPSGGNAATATGLTAGNYSVTITSANGCSTVKNFTITEPTAIVVTPSQINTSCNGGANGSASVVVTGGTGAYTYLWSPTGGTAATASGLSAGTYTVTIKDANLCEATQSFTITQPAALVVVPSQSNVSCNGGTNGSATATVTGGTGAYTYIWSPIGGTAATATGLAAGTYNVTVTDANFCQTTQTYTITEPAVLAATTSQVNVSCNGQSDASATVNVTGGTGIYAYSWSPSGGTAATATGLSAGNYTVTITDANSCAITKSVTIIVTPDVTAPVPNVTNLPAITNYCSILSAEIAIPTATDNCAGIITATTTDPLSYTTVGNYVITWSYNDGNGNITTQQQNLSVLASPLNQVTFSNAEFTFNGSVRTIQVANLPAGASVVYATTPATGTLNGAVNAGLYTVTATVSPAVSSPNCSPITLTAQLTIKKAAQQITFGALPAKILGANNNFNLDAFSNSGLPIRYSFTYTAALPPANVTASGLVSMIRSGSLLITAHQDGDSNYLPAADVSQTLVIKNNDVTVTSITIGGQVYNNPATNITYVMQCGQSNVNIAILNNTNATITPSANFTIAPPKPGIYTQNVTLTSEDGSTTANYTIRIEKPFGFYDIVKQKFNNVLLVNNNPQTNGGYEFVAYQWFKNGQLIGTGQYYTAGNDTNNVLDPTAVYSVKMTTKDGKILQTCESAITLQNTLLAKLYPNPVEVGKILTVEADYPAEDLADMQISLYSVTGQLIKTVQSSSVKTEIQLPAATEGNMYLVVLEGANIKKSFKVIVK